MSDSDALSMPKAVLFDWDNTLVDTWGTIHEAMNTTLAAMGHAPWSIAETHERVRLALREAFPSLFGDRWEEARDIFFGRFREIHLETLVSWPGAEELLQAVAAQGIYLGVVSNKSGDHLRREATHLGWDRYFGRIVGATDAVRDKPAVDPVHLALADSGFAPGRDVWFVGDTEVDMECAHNAECIGILVRDMAPLDGEFASYPPAHHFADCHGLSALVRNL